LKRRRKRLESRLAETKLLARGVALNQNGVAEAMVQYTTKKKIDVPENFNDLDEELNAEEYETYAQQVVDQATAAETVPELEAEITIEKIRTYLF